MHFGNGLPGSCPLDQGRWNRPVRKFLCRSGNKVVVTIRRNIVLVVIDREQNNVSHTLENIGRTSTRNMTWIGSGPDVVLAARLRDIYPKA
jgi:hypothetical protein